MTSNFKNQSMTRSKKNSGQEASSRKTGSRIPVSSSLNKPANSKLAQPKSQLSKSNTKFRNDIKPSGIKDLDFGGIVNTVGDVVGTVGKLASGDVAEVLNVPNTIMKVINTTSNIVSDLKKSDVPVPEKVPTLSSENLNQPNVENDKVLSEVKKYIPVVNMSSIPSSYANSISVPPIVRKDGILKNGQRYVNVTGSNMGVQMTYNAISANTLETVIAQRVHPNIGATQFGARLQTISQTFQKWRLNKFVIQYIPTQKTSEPGNIYMTVKQGTDLTTPVSVSSMSQNEFFNSNTSYATGSLVVPGNSGWYYTATDATTDFKFFTTWTVFLCSLGNISTIVPVAGQILYHYDIDFAAPVGAPNSNYYLDTISRITTSRLAYAPTDLVYRDFIRLGIKISSDLMQECFSQLNKSDSYYYLSLNSTLDAKSFIELNRDSLVSFIQKFTNSNRFSSRFEKIKGIDIRFTFRPLFERVFQEILESFGPFLVFFDPDLNGDYSISSVKFIHRVFTFILDKLDESVSDKYGLSDSEEEPDEQLDNCSK